MYFNNEFGIQPRLIERADDDIGYSVRVLILLIFYKVQRNNRNGRFETEPEAETRPAVLSDEKHRTGRASGCAAGGQTTGPGKRAVVSHVQTGSRDRSSPRVPRGDRSIPVNDRVASHENLRDYLQPRPRPTKNYVMLSASPLLSPDTARALENAEKLFRAAEKLIIEASYDIASSPERDSSIRSAGERRVDDDDDDDDDEALHIRDVVSTKFHEANESARIFTRPSTRPLSERVPRPEVRRSRGRRHGEKTSNIRAELPIAARRKPSKHVRRQVEECQSSFSPERLNRVPETTGDLQNIRSAKASIPSVQTSPGKNADRNETVLFRVQQGPRIDIRNDFTVTNVERVDISQQSSVVLAPKVNVKTYEFRHESCRNEEIVVGAGSPEVAEKSRTQARKCSEAAPAPSARGSGSDLVENKSGRSIPPERLEGPADCATTRIAERNLRASEDNDEIRHETFIDFLRRSASTDKRNSVETDRNAETPKQRVIGSPNKSDKITIFDRAVDDFFDEFKRSERIPPPIVEPRGRRSERAENCSLDGLSLDVPVHDERSVDPRKAALDDETEAECWDLDAVSLEPPNVDYLDKTLRNFEGTIDKVSRGARSLGVLILQYSNATGVGERSVIRPVDHGSRDIRPTSLRSGSMPRNKIPREVADLFDGKSADKSAPTRRRDAQKAQKAQIGERMEKKSTSKLADCHPRFSTPLGNGPRLENFDRSRGDSSSHEFARFFVGIQRPRDDPDARLKLAVTNEVDYFTADKRNELLPALEVERQERTVARNCSVDAPLNRDRSSNAGNEAGSRRTDTDLATYDVAKTKDSSYARESATRSIVQDSAIGGTTDRSDDVSFGTKLIDERSARKDSSRSERSAPGMRNDETSTRRSPATDRLTVEDNLVETPNMIEDKISDKRKPSEGDGTDKEKSAGCEEAIDKNHLVASAGSSIKDRTSFDVSTVYSDDFEEPIGITERSKSQGNLAQKKNSVKNVTSNEKELPIAVEATNGDKSDEILPNLLQKSIESSNLHDNSKREANYLEKSSISISVDKSSYKNQTDTEKTVSMAKETVEKRAERSTREKSDELSNDRDGAGSSFASMKASGTSSLVGESQREPINNPNESNEAGTPLHGLDGKKCVPCSCPLCEGIVSGCDCKECTSRPSLEGNDARAKSSSIRDGEDDEDEAIEANSHEEEYANSVENIAIETGEYSRKNRKESTDAEMTNFENRRSEEKKQDISEQSETGETGETGESSTIRKSGRIFRTDRHETNSKSFTYLEKIGKFDSSTIIHSTPKELIDNSTGPFEALVFPLSDPIPDDDYPEATGGTDARSENYSEGEIYLPSSCSYSLGEIRIYERPGRGTVDPGIESIGMHNDGIRFFIDNTRATLDTSDKALDAPNRPAQSPGEVQETDAESIYSSRDLSSDGEHRQANKSTARS